jgi:glycosyltransferase involved in cell wall biosynthesis
MKSVELHWVVDSPSPYNAQLFEYIAQNTDWNLLVHYKNMSLGTHPWKSELTKNHPTRYMQPRFGIDWELVRTALKGSNTQTTKWFVVGSWNDLNYWLLFLILIFRHHNLVLWTDTPNQARKRNPFKKNLRAMALKWLLRRCTYVMGTGQPAMDVLEDMGARPESLVNFPYWINVELPLVDRAPDTPTEPLIFMSTGLIQNHRKGHDIVIRALAELRDSAVPPFEYWIAGTGPDEEVLRTLANELGVLDKVRFLGWVEPEGLPGFLQQADVFVHPSPILEPYGVAVIEAMAAQLPILASDLTCAGLDRITVGENGFIHTAGDHKALAQHMAVFLAEPGRAGAMGRAALTTALQWPMSRATSTLQEIFSNTQTQTRNKSL